MVRREIVDNREELLEFYNDLSRNDFNNIVIEGAVELDIKSRYFRIILRCYIFWLRVSSNVLRRIYNLQGMRWTVYTGAKRVWYKSPIPRRITLKDNPRLFRWLCWNITFQDYNDDERTG